MYGSSSFNSHFSTIDAKTDLRLMVSKLSVVGLTLHAGQLFSSSAKTALKTSTPPLLAAEFRTVLLSLSLNISSVAAVEAATRFFTWWCATQQNLDADGPFCAKCRRNYGCPVRKHEHARNEKHEHARNEKYFANPEVDVLPSLATPHYAPFGEPTACEEIPRNTYGGVPHLFLTKSVGQNTK